MATKTKNNQPNLDTLSLAAKQAVVVLMTVAATFGMIDLPAQPDKRAIMPLQPAFGWVGETANREVQPTQLRREREETGPHYVSYSVTQRTPSRTGKI